MKSNTPLISFFGMVLLFSSCSTNEISPKQNNLSDQNLLLADISSDQYYDEMVADDSVMVLFRIEKVDEESINLVIDIELFGDSWIVSPLATDYPYGCMDISLEENKNLSVISSVIENPNSVKKIDEGVIEPFSVIETNTILIQKLGLKNHDDFEVKGSLFFVLEPICIPNYHGFRIVNKNGTFSINETKSYHNY